MTVAMITDVLGGRRALRTTVENEPELVSLTRKGFPVGALVSMAKEMRLPLIEVARVAGITERTLSRRITSKSRLSAHESDRMVRLAKVVAYAKEVLNSAEAASQWLQIPNRALEGERPVDLLDTQTGSQMVETILGRIAYGLYS